MSEPTGDDRACEGVETVYRSDSRRVLATLIRLLGDFDLAEEALHEAFAAAVEQWPREGTPAVASAPGVPRTVSVRVWQLMSR